MPTPALDWLYSTQLYGIKLGLDNVHKLLEALSNPQANLKFIHVAGTNGKGSTCAFMHAILKECEVKAGLFTSPHLIRFNERIQDTEREITDDEIETGLSRIRDLTADWETHPTFFEITLALALDWFRTRGVEWVVLETGLGGRLDATNVVIPEVSVLTRIGLDHVEQLGDTLAKIAGEKAGIIKPGVPVVSAPQDAEALKVIEAAAKTHKADLTLVEEPLTNVKLGLMGPHQAWNAAVAIEALREVGIRVPAVVLEEALQKVHWAGRFHSLEEGRFIVDGAHNSDGALALAWTWKTEFPNKKATIIFGGSTGKDLTEIMWPLAEIAERWILTPFRSPRSVPVEDLREALEEANEGGDWAEATSLDDACNMARQFPEKILVTGSLFLVGEFLSHVTASGAYQPSGQ